MSDGTESWHGKISAYRARKCRCEKCKGINSAKSKSWRETAKQRLSLGLVDVVHGKDSTYCNYGCRCEKCTAAHTLANKIRQQRRLRERGE